MGLRLRIATKLLLTILPLIIFAVGISAYLNNENEKREMLKQAQASAQTYSELIRESLVHMMMSRGRIDDDYINQVNNVRDVNNLHIHFATDSLKLKEIYLDSSHIARLRIREQLEHPLSPEEKGVFVTAQPYWQQKGMTYNSVIPFIATARCQQCHSVPEGYVLGAAEMDISLERMNASIESNYIRSIWIVYIFTSIAILLSMILYRFMVSRRMKSLVEETKIIGEGNLDHPVIIGTSQDELGELALAFETMRVKLKLVQDRLIHSERLSALGQMAGSIVHDFRSPMATINLIVESLQQGKQTDPSRIQEWYRLIRESVQRMVTMAQELLDFSKGETQLNKAEYSIGDFLTLVEKSVKLNLERAKIQFEMENTCKGPAVFDPDRLHRAIVNIINNAQDATPSGGVIKLITTMENGEVVFRISDTGSGIPAEIRDTIFEAFVTVGKKKGTGLGLAITKRIIDQHEGTIEVKSEIGRGTTFVIRLPLENGGFFSAN